MTSATAMGFIPERFRSTISLARLLVSRELKVKYRGSLLGYAWSMLNPLLFMVIITFVFRAFVKNIEHYHLYVLSGILMWNAATLSILSGAQSIVNNASLIRKVRVRSWVFPLVSVCTGLTNFLLASLPFALVLIFTRQAVPYHFLGLIPVVALYLIFLYGVSLTVASLNVFFRDVGHVLEPIMTLLFYSTPIVYSREVLAASVPHANLVLLLNPFTHFVEAFHVVLGGYGTLRISQIYSLGGIAFFSFVVGVMVYRKASGRIVFSL